jgi:tRNA1Val (adenine37-N6)-methyltransferase
MSENGSFWMILPFQDKQLIMEIAEKSGLFPEIDYSVNGKPNQVVRTVFCFSQLKPTAIESHEITIRNNDNSYTEAYKKLTVDFHGVKL